LNLTNVNNSERNTKLDIDCSIVISIDWSSYSYRLLISIGLIWRLSRDCGGLVKWIGSCVWRIIVNQTSNVKLRLFIYCCHPKLYIYFFFKRMFGSGLISG
jgi:hypothetical protein